MPRFLHMNRFALLSWFTRRGLDLLDFPLPFLLCLSQRKYQAMKYVSTDVSLLRHLVCLFFVSPPPPLLLLLVRDVSFLLSFLVSSAWVFLKRKVCQTLLPSHFSSLKLLCIPYTVHHSRLNRDWGILFPLVSPFEVLPLHPSFSWLLMTTKAREVHVTLCPTFIVSHSNETHSNINRTFLPSNNRWDTSSSFNHRRQHQPLNDDISTWKCLKVLETTILYIYIPWSQNCRYFFLWFMWFKTEEEEAKERQDLLSASGKESMKDSISSLLFSYFFFFLLYLGSHDDTWP